jgi:hypothetical protein
MSRGSISPAAPALESRFEQLDARLNAIKPRAKSVGIADDFVKQVIHLQIERLGRPWDGTGLRPADADDG